MDTQTLAFEIGTEELPAFDLHKATAQLGGLAAGALDAAGVPHGSVAVYTTPRRLVLVVQDVPEVTEASTQEYRGPSAAIAFDETGAPTQAALGFARGKGVEADALERRDEDGSEYVYAIVETPAVHVAEILPALLQGIIDGISWPKTQRWGNRNEVFARPVRWLCALLGSRVIPVEYAGLTAGNQTYGHRFLAPGPHEVASADALIDVLRAAYVVPSEAEREASIREQVAKIEAETGLVADLPAHTTEEVVNLCEYPTVLVGQFDELFLDVPKEITVDAMLMHQRYFPLFAQDGSLTNKFLITSNGDPDCSAGIVDGNERVVAARLYDAKFFYDEDLKQPLEAYVDKLDSVVFQEQLGTTRAKTKRIVELAKHLSADAGLPAQDAKDAARAAYLCKADLVSGAVVEFTSVQGIMGSYYASASGENLAVAQAIKQHYQPKFAGDAIPETLVGQVVATADKLDTICGLFAVDQGPTGSSDPFALRRSALGIVAMLEAGLPISLERAIDASLDAYASQGINFDKDVARKAVIDFFITRTKVMLRDEGNSADAVDAVLSAGVVEPATVAARTRALEHARAEAPDTMEDLAVAHARANNLRDATLGTAVDEALCTEPEQALSTAITEAQEQVAAALEEDDYPAALAALAALRAPIDNFFEQVMVMDEDAAVRENRLRLLNRFVGVFTDVADFSLLAKV